jgi:CheY-like chemotaxis protein
MAGRNGGTKVEEIFVDDITDQLKGKKALMVDDVEINRVIAINMLESTGIIIDEVESGEDAIEVFAESAVNEYSIIYMDILMPGIDGYEATLAIRAMDRSDAKTVPIVALTANAFEEDIDKALDCGMNGHLAKPLDMEKAIETTFRLLGA